MIIAPVAVVVESVVFVPVITPAFVIEFVFIFIVPAIVPPASSKYGPPTTTVLISTPESLITLSETNVHILFKTPVEVLLTMLSTVLVFVPPINDPLKYPSFQ